MELELARAIAAALEAGEPAWLVTVTRVEGSAPARLGARMLVTSRGPAAGTVGGGALELRAIRACAEAGAGPRRLKLDLGAGEGGEPVGMACAGRVELLVEPLGAPDRLNIFGAGHCAIELSRLAARLNFAVTVLDDRPEWCNRERHPDAARLVCAPFAEAVERVEFGDHCWVAIMTHGHAHDEEILRRCLGRPLAYLGMIGSTAKVRECFDRLLRDGYSRDELARVHAPIGFATGSQTPAEIAASVAAQLIAVRNNVARVPLNSNPLLGPGA